MPAGRDRVRLYHRVRSAHLERASVLPAATIVYGGRRYDFEESAAGRLELVHASGWRLARFMLGTPIAALEVNEPLMLHGIRQTSLALAAVAVRRAIGGPRTRVVSYSIENLDPRALEAPLRLRHRMGARLDRALSRFVWRRVDRIVYGTAAAQDLYARVFASSSRRPESRLVPALPAPALPSTEEKRPDQVVFLGAFVGRKGFPLVVDAWPSVARARPGARLVLVGKGELGALAEGLASRDPTVEVIVDPPRERIRDVLAASQVLVLPSQRGPAWREQVGLPIVEGLSYGCTIVTTPETGLASWLAENGHRVIEPGADAGILAQALLDALDAPVPATDVLASLPDEDGRLAADGWLFDGIPANRR